MCFASSFCPCKMALNDMLFLPVRGKNFVLRGWKLLLPSSLVQMPTSFVQTTLSTMQTATTAEEITRLIGTSHADGRDFPPVQVEVLASASRKKHVAIYASKRGRAGEWRRKGQRSDVNLDACHDGGAWHGETCIDFVFLCQDVLCFCPNGEPAVGFARAAQVP